MSSDPDALDRLDALVARLEALGLSGPRPGGMAAVAPDGYPSHVVAGDVIESAWGNATVDKLRAAPTGYIGHSLSATAQSINSTPIILENTVVYWTQSEARYILVHAQCQFNNGNISQAPVVMTLATEGGYVSTVRGPLLVGFELPLSTTTVLQLPAGNHQAYLIGSVGSGFATVAERAVTVIDIGN